MIKECIWWLGEIKNSGMFGYPAYVIVQIILKINVFFLKKVKGDLKKPNKYTRGIEGDNEAGSIVCELSYF